MSRTINYGGSAFPCGPTAVFSIGGDDCSSHGMSMRDYFAAKALPSLLHLWHKDLTASKADPDFCGLCIVDNEGGTPDGIAEEAYAIADAMLRARESK